MIQYRSDNPGATVPTSGVTSLGLDGGKPFLATTAELCLKAMLWLCEGYAIGGCAIPYSTAAHGDVDPTDASPDMSVRLRAPWERSR